MAELTLLPGPSHYIARRSHPAAISTFHIRRGRAAGLRCMEIKFVKPHHAGRMARSDPWKWLQERRRLGVERPVREGF
jgi:hypothetical protein